jgi:hypothetical protein
MGLRRAGHVFFGKNPLYPYPFTRHPPPVPAPLCPRNSNLKNPPPVYIKSIPVPAGKKTAKKIYICKIKTAKEKKQQQKKIPVPVYPRRARV